MPINTGLRLWSKAESVILGGNGLLSKSPSRYSPLQWPTYFSKCKGVEVWDLDGNRYVDMAQMAIGSSVLGYANDELNEAVVEAINGGVNCTLNSPDEVLLAEEMLKFTDGQSRVKFARTGGEAMSQAIRVGRAASGRSKVVFSGYHGWHDWYISANLKGDKLSDHLIPGLIPYGIPKELEGTAVPFRYNDPEDVLRIQKEQDDIGVICVEGARYEYPSLEFVEAVKQLQVATGAILISDEITSGWRVSPGGVLKTLGCQPNIEVFGKALGGGFAISAIVGHKETMEKASASFMSSTMWTERVGFVAARKTIEILNRENVYKHLQIMGQNIIKVWKKAAKKNNLSIYTGEFYPLATFKFQYEELNDHLMTIFCEEMLARGYLASNSVYVCWAHDQGVIDVYAEAIEEVFGIISHALQDKNISLEKGKNTRSDAFGRMT